MRSVPERENSMMQGIGKVYVQVSEAEMLPWPENGRILMCLEYEGETYWYNKKTGKWVKT